MDSYFIVGISGVTCGGKTTLASKLSKMFKDCIVFNQDDYFYPDDSPKHVKVPNMDHVNYDIMSSMDMDKMYKDITAALLASSDGTQRLMIIEGFIVLNYEPIAKLCNLKYYLTLEKEECKRRRDLRTYNPPDIPGYFEECAWPEYCKSLEELKGDKSITFLNCMEDNMFEKIVDDILKNRYLKFNG